MTNKKAPDAWRRWGRDGTCGKQSPSPKYAASCHEAQGHSCADCAFHRNIVLPSGRRRMLCMLTGEKLRSSAGRCENFQSGKWGDEGLPTARPYPIRQGFVCRSCGNGLVPTLRAALLGLVGCMAGHVVAEDAPPFPCAGFHARRAADVR